MKTLWVRTLSWGSRRRGIRSTQLATFQSPTRARFFSAETKDEEPEHASEESEETVTSSSPIIFPWRHEENPLPRVVEGTIDYETKGQLLTSTSMKPGDKTMNALASAFMFLDVPLYQFLFFGSWKAELADNASWAFTQGVAGLLSSLSSATMDSIIHNTYEVNFQQTIESVDGDTPKEEEEVPLEDMFDDNLLSLYKDSRKNISSATEISLKIIPYQAELVSLYAIPYITRQKVRQDKGLLKFYRNMMEKPSMDRAPDLNKLRREHLEAGRMESTVIAQILVWCEEVFHVTDVASGNILQGVKDGDESNTRKIPHLIRMETTVKTIKDEAGSFRNVQGNWIITDIDDLLDGNLII